MISSSSIGSRNLDTVSETALYFAMLAARLNDIEVDEKYMRILGAKETISFFDLPYGTQGFQTHEKRYSSIQLKCDEGSLKCIVAQGFPEKYGKIYKKTYFVPDEVYDAMRSVGIAMPDAVRETGKGGLAATVTGQAIAERINKE